MGIFDNYQFNPQSFSGGQGGLLEMLMGLQQQPNGGILPQPTGIPGSGPDAPTSQYAMGDTQVPLFGQPQATDMSAQSRPQIAPQAQQQQMAPQQSGGLRAGFEGFMNNLHNGPIGAVMGGLGGAMGMDGGSNVTVKALMAKGLDLNTAKAAAANPTLLAALVPQLFGTKSGTVINNRLVNPATGQVIADFSDTKAPETKEFEGLNGGKVAMQFNARSGKWEPVPGIPSSGAGKPPANYTWVDPNDPEKGVKGIPGGPATQLPSEVAGRMAMMDIGAAELPKAREVLLRSRGSYGLKGLDGVGSTIGVGEVARAERSVRVAIEGALRSMTGAAAPDSEVKSYADKFLPSPMDSRETATQKLNQLQDFIDGAKRLVNQGRGPAANQSPGKPSDPLGIR